MASISTTLFTHAIHGCWDEVVEICTNNPELHGVKITKSGDSVLHLAVQDGRDEVVVKLVNLIFASDTSDRHKIGTLRVENARGNTPLHFAAAQGSATMCHAIANKFPQELVRVRNNEGDTPIFVAALNGKKEAFLCLHSLIPQGQGYSFCRGVDGNTFLHCALNGDNFDLAFQIIHLYRGLQNSVNVQGDSPLHLLARKPSAFGSSNRFGRIDQLIYNCSSVTRLKVDDTSRYCSEFPENYCARVNFFNLFWRMFRGLRGVCSRISVARAETDIESQDMAETFGSSKVSKRNSNTEKGVPNSEENRMRQAVSNFLKAGKFAMCIILGVGYKKMQKIQETKQRNTWSLQIVEELLKESSEYLYEDCGQEPRIFHLDKDAGVVPYDTDESSAYARQSTVQGGKDGVTKSKEAGKRYLEVFPVALTDKDVDRRKKILLLAVDADGGKTNKSSEYKRQTPILVAAKNGITEMVERIHQLFPIAVNDKDIDGKNVVLLAVENRQPHVYKYFLSEPMVKDNVFRMVDKEGNSVLHLAAMLQDDRPWLVPGAALQLHLEYMWYEFVKSSKPSPHFFPKHNKRGQTPQDAFTETHKDLVGAANKWLSTTAQSCSVVAVLVATMAYTTSTTIPGGFKEDGGSGEPILGKQSVFDVFAIAGLVAFISSVMALVMFFPVFTSYDQVRHFRRAVPTKLVVGLTLLFLSLTAIMISFSAADSFIVVKGNLKYLKIPLFAAACLPIMLVANQFPVYLSILRALVGKNIANLSSFRSDPAE